MKPDRAAILADLRRILREQLRVSAPIELDTDVQRDLQLDSVRLLALVVELENHFEVCFEPGDEEGISTVGDLVHRLEAILAAGGPRRPE